jgi:protein CpxP
MSRWKFGRAAVLGSLGALALAATSVQAGDEPGRQGRHQWREMRMGRDLNLTDEQRASFKSIREEHRKAQEPLRQQHRELRQQIRQQLEGGNADPTAIGQLTIQAHALGRQLRESHAGLRERFEALLTPEQKARLEELKSQRGQRGQRRLGRPGRPAPPSGSEL